MRRIVMLALLAADWDTLDRRMGPNDASLSEGARDSQTALRQRTRDVSRLR